MKGTTRRYLAVHLMLEACIVRDTKYNYTLSGGLGEGYNGKRPCITKSRDLYWTKQSGACSLTKGADRLLPSVQDVDQGQEQVTLIYLFNRKLGKLVTNFVVTNKI